MNEKGFGKFRSISLHSENNFLFNGVKSKVTIHKKKNKCDGGFKLPKRHRKKVFLWTQHVVKSTLRMLFQNLKKSQIRKAIHENRPFNFSLYILKTIADMYFWFGNMLFLSITLTLPLFNLLCNYWNNEVSMLSHEEWNHGLVLIPNVKCDHTSLILNNRPSLFRVPPKPFFSS